MVCRTKIDEINQRKEEELASLRSLIQKLQADMVAANQVGPRPLLHIAVLEKRCGYAKVMRFKGVESHLFRLDLGTTEGRPAEPGEGTGSGSAEPERAGRTITLVGLGVQGRHANGSSHGDDDNDGRTAC